MGTTSSIRTIVWSGMDVHTEDPEELRAIEQFYRDSYLQQIDETYPDFDNIHLYELIADRARGSRGPKFLTSFELSHSQDSEQPDLGQGLLPIASAPAAWQNGIKSSWSLVYRHVSETGPESVIPYAIYMVGVNPPAGLNAGELKEFNDFYTNVHLPEVAERRHCLRATRYELYRELRASTKKSPQFLAIYELDEKAASNKRHIGGPYASGPEVWRRHTTPWRLWYRRLAD